MMNYLLSLFVTAFILTASTSLEGLAMNDANLTLAPLLPPKPKVLGITFGASPTTVRETVAAMGLKFVKQESLDARGYQKVLTFQGIPDGMALQQGSTQFFFFRNELVKMALQFTPSYENFLLIKQQLLMSVGDRYSVAEHHEHLEKQVRTRLAHLGKGEYNEDAEQLVQTSLSQGKSFFYYALTDNNREVDISYSFRGLGGSAETRKPELVLDYKYQTGIDAYKTFLETQKRAQSKRPSAVPQ